MGRKDSGKRPHKSAKTEGTFRNRRTVKGGAQHKKNTPSNQASDPNMIRLNKYLSNSGVCSRRDADIYIAAGQVTVNGKAITEMGHKVKLSDTVKFDGRLLNPIKREYVLLNKPKDFMTSGRDDQGKRTALSLISKASKTPLKPVGKLDKDTTGLLIFTNDGELTKRLNSPKNGLRKIYHVELAKPLRSADLKRIQEGLPVDEKVVKVQDASYVENAPKNQVGIEIYSTRSNIVRRMFEELDCEIIKLDRVVYAGLTKKDLPRGHWRYLTKQEVINLGMIQ